MKVRIRAVEIMPHENADSLELAKIDDYLAVVRKGVFHSGDLVAYIPEGAIIPTGLLEYMGLTGQLAGPEKNRVQARRLRGVLSQGLVVQLPLPGGDTATEGEDVMAKLGIVKYEPIAPWQRPALAGDNVRLPEVFVYPYDIENIKRWTNCFNECDEVVVTEKIHGSLLAVCALPSGGVWVTSKGLMGRGTALSLTSTKNAYVALAERYKLTQAAQQLAEETCEPISLFGEMFGRGIQDLTYGSVETSFRLFDIRIGHLFMSHCFMQQAAHNTGIPAVPVLFRGPFDRAIIQTLTSGLETVSGRSQNIREGVVVKSATNFYDPIHGRKVVKSINAAYLLRKNGTDFN